MALRTLTLVEFGEALAARTPVPGGGAVAAVTASHAAALLSMVLEFTLGKPAYAAHESSNAAALAQARVLQARALALADRDAEAYGALNALWKLPKDSPARAAAWEPAVAEAIAAPQAILDTAAEIAATARGLHATTNRALASDLAIALDLACVAARAAAHNVEVNLPGVAEPSARADADARMRAALHAALGTPGTA